MKNYVLLLMAGCLIIGGSTVAMGQTGGPPKVLLIVREEIKPGMMGPHASEANNVVRIYSKAKSPYHRLAMVPVAGNENEVMYFWGFDSFATMEKSNKDLDAMGITYKSDFDKIRPSSDDDYHASQRDAIAVLREDLSYGGPIDIGKMRYMRFQTIRVKPGHQRDFENGRKIMKVAHEKAKIAENMAVFQMVGGAQTGTYLVIIPWASLDGLATIPHGKNYFDAMGDDNSDKLDKINNEAVLFDSVDIYAFAPQLSYASDQMIASDPGFWALKPKAMSPSATTAKKMKPKP